LQRDVRRLDIFLNNDEKWAATEGNENIIGMEADCHSNYQL
jgi:hypothetical protein